MARRRPRSVAAWSAVALALALGLWSLRPRGDAGREGDADGGDGATRDGGAGPAEASRSDGGTLAGRGGRSSGGDGAGGSGAPVPLASPSPSPRADGRSAGATARTVVGLVLDDDGPVAGARVIVDVERPDARVGVGDGTPTDAHGRFAIDGPWGDEPARFRVTVLATGRVADGVETAPGVPTVVRMQRAGFADVRVVDDETGAPLHGATVQRAAGWATRGALGPATGDDRYRTVGRLHARAVRTDADGRARVAGPVGSATATVVAPGRRRGTASLRFGDAEAPPTEVRLGPATKRVTYRGVLRDDDGAPIAGAVLHVPDAAPDDPGALTDAEGAFVLEDAELGLVVTPLRTPRGGRAFARFTRLSDLERGDTEIRVAARVEGAGGWCEGVALRDGRPLEGAVLRSGCAEHPTEEARTDATGRFRLPVPEGCWVEVEAPDGLRWPVSLVPRPDLVVEVPLSAVVRGAVTDRALRPVVGARVSCPRAGSTLTDAEGRYALVVPAGRVRLAASCPGYAWAQTPEWEVAPGTTAARDLRLEPGGTVVGRVVGPDGTPIADATVVVRGRGGIRREVTVPTHRDGSFVAESVAGPPFRVTVTADGHLPAELDGVEADVAVPTIVLTPRPR